MGMDECGLGGEACLCVHMGVCSVGVCSVGVCSVGVCSVGVCSVGTCTWIWMSVHVHVLTAKSLPSFNLREESQGRTQRGPL